MRKIKTLTPKSFFRTASFVLSVMHLIGCSTIFEDRSDCPEGFRIHFRYDYNLKNANAFASEVKKINLYVFDNNGKFYDSYSEKGDVLKDESYFMTPSIASGTYKMIAIGGNEDDKSFITSNLIKGETNYNDFIMTLNTANDTINYEISPLWHGMLSSQDVTGGYQVVKFPLIKNTNMIRVNLLQKKGELNVNDFVFELKIPDKITGYDNSIICEDTVVYKPFTWGQKFMITDIGEGGSAYASFHCSRITEDSGSKVIVYKKADGSRIFDIDLNRLISEYRMEKYSHWSLQEYLDKQDEYTFTFILDENLNWLDMELIINGWVVRNNHDEI